LLKDSEVQPIKSRQPALSRNPQKTIVRLQNRVDTILRQALLGRPGLLRDRATHPAARRLIFTTDSLTRNRSRANKQPKNSHTAKQRLREGRLREGKLRQTHAFATGFKIRKFFVGRLKGV
jgi:hypothetical protein